MNKELILSVLLFFVGLGFITGFNGTFPQLFSAVICFVFLAMPLYMRAIDLMRKVSSSRKKEEATF